MTKVESSLHSSDSIEVRPGQKPMVRVSGCRQLLDLIQQFRHQHGDTLTAWPEPTGHSHPELLLREAIRKAKGEWQFPYEHTEICHCRAIGTKLVDEAIISGAHTTERVSALTSASTACGTCRPHVQEIIDYRLSVKTT